MGGVRRKAGLVLVLAAVLVSFLSIARLPPSLLDGETRSVTRSPASRKLQGNNFRLKGLKLRPKEDVHVEDDDAEGGAEPGEAASSASRNSAERFRTHNRGPGASGQSAIETALRERITELEKTLAQSERQKENAESTGDKFCAKTARAHYWQNKELQELRAQLWHKSACSEHEAQILVLKRKIEGYQANLLGQAIASPAIATTATADTTGTIGDGEGGDDDDDSE